MKGFRFLLCGAILIAVVIVSINLSAKVRSIRDLKRFDDYVSLNYLITVVMAYTQPKGLSSTEKRAIREAERGLRDISENVVYKKVKVKFAQVNLDRVPQIADDYQLTKDPHTVSLLFFRRGQLIATAPVELEESSAYGAVYNATKDGIEQNFAEYINQILQEMQDLEEELARTRAAAPRYITPWYSSPWWDYYYHGYYYPYYRYRRPGFGFHISL